MNAKKLMAGVLAGTMIMSAVPVMAKSDPNYVAKMTDASKGGTVKEGTITDCSGNASFKSTWWNPQTFSNSLLLTDKAVTVTLKCTSDYAADASAYYGDQSPFVFVFSSDTGAIYGGNAADESYEVGVQKNMVEYCGIRGDGKIYSKDWAHESAWDGATLTKGTCDDWIVDITGACGWGGDNQPAYEQWCVDNNKGYTATITAGLQGNNAVITYEYAGNKHTTKINVGKTLNKTYICLASGNAGGTLSDITYKYASVSADDITVTPGNTTFTYTGKPQVPTFDIKFKGATALVAGTDYDVVVTDSNKKASAGVNAGNYTATVTFKGAYAEYAARETSFVINKASQSVKLKKTTATVKLKNLKKKAQTVKIYVKATKDSKATFNVAGADSKTKKAIKKVAKGKKSGSYTMFKVTLKKNKKAKKATYTLKAYSKSSTNFKQSSAKKFKIKVK